MSTTGERNFERDERQVRLSVAYSQLDEDMARDARNFVSAKQGDDSTGDQKRKESPQ